MAYRDLHHVRWVGACSHPFFRLFTGIIPIASVQACEIRGYLVANDGGTLITIEYRRLTACIWRKVSQTSEIKASKLTHWLVDHS